MTQAEFKALPYLLLEHQVAALGYDRRTVAKFADCGVLHKVEPAGSGHARYQKRQLAQLLGLEATLELAEFRREPLLMSLKSVRRWTGFTEETLAKIVQAGGLRRVQPPGSSHGKYLKEQIARLIGFES
jgi:hypothetical protein